MATTIELRGHDMRNLIISSVLLEGAIILISILAIISRGGHSGMMVFLLLHTPSALLSIFVGDFVRENSSSEALGAVFTVLLSVILQLLLFFCIFFGLNTLIK